MRAWLAVCITLAAACSGGGTKPVTEPTIVDKKAACDAGDMASCVEVGRSECVDAAWQIEYDRPPALYVAKSGLARLDRLNMLLLSTNANEWLACIEECPGTGATNICIPFVLDMRFGLDTRTDCRETEREVLSWNGHATKIKLRDCPGELAEITYVPELADVQRALVTAEVIQKGSPLDINGLIVKLTVGGAPIMTMANVGDANCNVFDVPEGYKMVRGAAPFERARAMQPSLQRKFDQAQVELRRELEAALRAAQSRVEPEVRRLCSDAGYKVEDSESLASCTFELEAARALITKAISEEMERARIAAEPKVDEALRTHVIEPLCREFSAAAD